MPGTLLIGFRTASGGYTVVSAANPLPVTGGGGGGGGAVTIVDGGSVALGSIGDDLWDGASDDATLIAISKKASSDLTGVLGNSTLSLSALTAIAQSTSDTVDELQAPATGIPPRTIAFTGGDSVVTSKKVTGASPFTAAAADTDERWALVGLALSFTAACTLTVEGGTEDLELDVPGAGILVLDQSDLPFGITAVNTALTVSWSAGTCKGKIYFAKGT